MTASSWLSARFSECFLIPGGSDLIDRPTYGTRMRRHAGQCFAGETCVEYPFAFTRLFAPLHPEKAQHRPRRGDIAG
ncbi:hypothetical protein PV396_08625 [Streptomyces sp. ME02-8801-2C]|uniref:hypothetical protein n=1 Tax=Streptomyces sp. ME02-8801-2C TaxID=3028680 RepID=UPI0029B3DDF2|nr:hypothetical protein [Streptomyces sp. ME02-8801-2C]MDX3452012.1 hypothetical protein [Streptomyces sp. ME02-8801-2C]